LHIGNLPPSVVAELSLEERILAEEGWSDLKQGRESRAEKTLSKLGLESPIYAVGLGYINSLSNKLQAAEKFFKQALQARPELALAHFGLAQIYQKTGKEDQAFAALREVLKTEPDNLWAKQQYESLKDRKLEEVLAEAKSALDADDIKKGKAALLKALYYAPQHMDSHLKLAEIYKKENKLQNALVHLKAASSTEPENADILRNYAETLSRLDRSQKAYLDTNSCLSWSQKMKRLKTKSKNLETKSGLLSFPPCMILSPPQKL
jgi:Tfp pilus assembly protein PilF